MKSVLEKTNNVMTFIFLFGLIYLVNNAQCAGKCYCGFGGPCRFNRDTHDVVKTDCSKCGMASKGLYRNCHQLLDHCDSQPCENGGKCVMTFGGFFCRCPPEFYGHTCENTRKKYETFEQVSGPRVWYQVNRVWGGLSRQNQIIHFAVEAPGDGMVVYVNFDDGRSITILDTDLRMNNERKTCLEESRKWSLSNDPNICETLPDEVLYSKKIHVGYFDDKFNPEPAYDVMTAQVGGKNVSEGRLDDVQITIMNWRRITYTEKYRIHTVYDIWPKCLYKINFFGCSLDKETPVLHEGGSSIYLKAIRIPVTDCGGAGRVRQMKWYMEGAGENPFLSHRNKEEVHLDGTDLSPGRHFVDFLMTVEGRPNFHGHPDLSYNYGRCWIKIVLGQFRVGIEGGNSVTAPCIKPLTLRIFSYNKNYKELNFASIWRCNMKHLEVCERQRFLGSKVFFRTLPCGIIIQFKAMVVDVPTGSKTILTAIVKTSIHIDTMHCSCTYNCYPTINPLSPVKMRVEMIRYSTSKLKTADIMWKALFADEPWGIERFIIPETRGTGIEIPPNTFSNLSRDEIAFPVLQITAFTIEMAPNFKTFGGNSPAAWSAKRVKVFVAFRLLTAIFYS